MCHQRTKLKKRCHILNFWIYWHLIEKVASSFGSYFNNCPAGIYMHKVYNRNTRTRCEVCSNKDTRTNRTCNCWLVVFSKQLNNSTLIMQHEITRGSRSEMFYEIGILKKFAKFIAKFLKNCFHIKHLLTQESENL